MLFVIQSVQAQLTSFGSVEQLGTGRKVSFQNNHLYAATSQGLYVREVDNTESDWEKLPFTDYAVKDFGRSLKLPWHIDAMLTEDGADMI